MNVETDTYFADAYIFRPAHPDMLYFKSREDTFQNWPIQLHQKPQDLALSGFFYTDKGDQVTCFYCDLKLRQWNKEDFIHTEHTKWKPNCLYSKMVFQKM